MKKKWENLVLSNWNYCESTGSENGGHWRGRGRVAAAFVRSPSPRPQMASISKLQTVVRAQRKLGGLSS